MGISYGDEEMRVLWIKTGNFKNIEEFKATTGGLISYLLDEKDDEKTSKRSYFDNLKRSVGLISWMEVDEVQPLLLQEGLIHLCALLKVIF